MHILAVATGCAVHYVLHAFGQGAAGLLHPHRYQPVVALLCESPADMQILAWKSLVNK
jgi:hypothetical protein